MHFAKFLLPLANMAFLATAVPLEDESSVAVDPSAAQMDAAQAEAFERVERICIGAAAGSEVSLACQSREVDSTDSVQLKAKCEYKPRFKKVWIPVSLPGSPPHWETIKIPRCNVCRQDTLACKYCKEGDDPAGLVAACASWYVPFPLSNSEDYLAVSHMHMLIRHWLSVQPIYLPPVLLKTEMYHSRRRYRTLWCAEIEGLADEVEQRALLLGALGSNLRLCPFRM